MYNESLPIHSTRGECQIHKGTFPLFFNVVSCLYCPSTNDTRVKTFLISQIFPFHNLLTSPRSLVCTFIPPFRPFFHAFKMFSRILIVVWTSSREKRVNNASLQMKIANSSSSSSFSIRKITYKEFKACREKENRKILNPLSTIIILLSPFTSKFNRRWKLFAHNSWEESERARKI